MKVLLLSLLLLFSCGKKGTDLNIEKIAIDEFLIFDSPGLCVGRFKVQRYKSGTIFGALIDQISCRGYNLVLQQFLSEKIGAEKVIEDGEPVFILTVEDMLKLQKFLLDKGIILDLGLDEELIEEVFPEYESRNEEPIPFNGLS